VKAALLLVDLQRGFFSDGLADKLAGVEPLLRGCTELIDLLRQRQLPVVWIRVVHKVDRSTWNQWMLEHDTGRFLEGTPEAELHPDLHPHPSDIHVVKTRSSAFLRTDLEATLRDLGIGAVVVAGYSINFCVGLTALDAYERDFRVLLAGDAILGTNHEKGRQMVEYLGNFGLEPVSTADIVAALDA
jgi:nicotinamidase-related amidase